jgi:PhzF family phenazine biosynthesis protein
MNTVQFAVIDAFTNQPFSGNPAATILLDEFPPAQWMQLVAAELNLSETSFAKPLPAQGINHFQLRWFTPTREVPLCGHATLAMAYYLYTQQVINLEVPVTFHTLSGELTVTYHSDQIEQKSGDIQISMNFPAVKLKDCDAKSLTVLEQIFARQTTKLYTVLGMADEYLLVLLPEACNVAEFIPELNLISELAGFGFVITAIADPEAKYDFVSRFFAPKAGINEDPVTGSAHCSLTPYWCDRLGKNHLQGRQLSARTGNITVTNCDERVLLTGAAVMVLKGEILGK